MRIEYDFFSQAQEKIRQSEEQLAIEEKNMTEEERSENKRKQQNEADKIIDYVKELYQVRRYVPNKKRIQEFSDLYKKAICLAKYMDCNIVIESDLEKQGKITLYSESFLLDESTSREMLTIFEEIMKSAETVWYTAEKNVVEIQFIYKLADIVYVKSSTE